MPSPLIPPSLPQWATAANLAPPAPPQAAADSPPPFTDVTVVRGAAPSTFDAQAAKLARGEPAVAGPVTTAALPAPVRPQVKEPALSSAASTAPRGFQIQIGAYQSAAEAERQLSAVRERAAGILSGGTAVTLPVQQGQKSFFRARYSGFDAASAAKACDGLKRIKIDCLVVRPE